MRLTLNQLDMAIAALQVVQRFAGPADGVLRHFFRDNSKLGVNDRAFITETVFGVLRHFFPSVYRRYYYTSFFASCVPCKISRYEFARVNAIYK